MFNCYDIPLKGKIVQMETYYTSIYSLAIDLGEIRIIEYAKVNLNFFKNHWHPLQSPSKAHTNLWSGRKVAGIISMLHTCIDKSDAKVLVSQYQSIYKTLIKDV